MPTIREELTDGGILIYCDDFYSRTDADERMITLRETLNWEQLIGRFQQPFPRLTAYYADEGVDYAYSGVIHHGEGWPDVLQEIKDRIEPEAETTFNSVLLNLYRDQTDSMGYHADDEPELGPNPIVGSISFGAARRFLLKHNETKELRQYDLVRGSMLIMAGTLQHHWKHAVPRTSQARGERINLTFRTIHDSGGQR